jgi:hypothetical protein
MRFSGSKLLISLTYLAPLHNKISLTGLVIYVNKMSVDVCDLLLV